MRKPRVNSKKKQNSNKPASRNKDWSVETWKDERTGVHFVEIGFPRIDGSLGIVQVPMDQIDTPAAVRKMLRKQGALLDRDSREADKFVEKTLAEIPDTVHVIASVPGWRKNLFLLPGRVIGKSNRLYRLRRPGDGLGVIGVTSGTVDEWKQNVAEPALNSSYIAFGIMAGLAAPLQRFSSLTEGVIFNFAGESSTGKTTAAKVAATVAGAPSPLPSWNITDRRLDERAAEYSDILLVLDDTEKRSGRTKNTAQVLTDAAHVMTDGQSKDYSDVVSGPDRLERLQWRCLALSTSPVTAEAYASGQGPHPGP
jgi:putative DNA primase/helicase